ncbi:endonuclease/exonuclease/phosphatase family protein [Roseibacillus ishigakijimensis]|uniref:Endonuclease/exonuclease/phosphatase family protein n=1 Tax=Roseibacillus ishigakijimensis TaxID=454146 RepID=A0A934RNV2_9BACT|nr:endonuclease/exonuclease/phosphatase family protein [Roseibacillus ishigakijimensis]
MFQNAPFAIGAFFLVFVTLSCKESESTAEWVVKPAEEQVAQDPPPESRQNTPQAPPIPPSSGHEVRFLSYNLENYLTMPRGEEERPKPEKEISPLIEIIVSERPDVLGVCEIGKESDLQDLQERLAAAGLSLPYHEHAGGSDDTRHLGLLSRYPIVARNSQATLDYRLSGRTWLINRGILDATIAVGDQQLRFLGAHLKSKREIEAADQELIRLNEARLLRSHAEEILTRAPETRLLVYGDFNDTINSPALHTLRGEPKETTTHLRDYYFKDSRGELWTHFWNYQDTYSRFDYVLYSEPLKSHFYGKGSYIVDHENWWRASDHRPLMLVITL